MDGRLVPRAPPRPPACVALGRPRPAQGGRGSLSWSRRARRARPLPSVREPQRPPPLAVPAHSVIRDATDADRPLVRELFREFMRELGDAPHRDDDTEEDLAKIERRLGKDLHVLIAERDGEAAGLAVAEKAGTRVGYLGSLFVRLGAQGVEVLELDVLASNESARAIYERWGFAAVQLNLAAPLDGLEQRLVRSQGPTFGSIHVQTDDKSSVERAVQKALPRFGRSAGTSVTGPRNGWVAVRDELVDRD